jgi:uncharacterized protein (TIGR02145 family)
MYDLQANLHDWDENNAAGLPQGVCPDGWRLPTKAEFQTLLDVTTNSDNGKGDWTTISNTAGREFITGGGEIFLSASGADGFYGYGGTGAGYYLTSDTNNTMTGILQFGSTYCDMTNDGTHSDYWLSVRCVRDL